MTPALRNRAPFLSRRKVAGLLLVAVCGALHWVGASRGEAAELGEVRLDWATYNPVSLVLKEKGFLEAALKEKGIAVRWTQSLGSNKALEYLNGGAIDFGSSAGASLMIFVPLRSSRAYLIVPTIVPASARPVSEDTIGVCTVSLPCILSR